ncbi:MAG: hypothetical protein HYR55_14270 [Acidobacteria bacterium]|nr:hypothetical protein [Acidobacteriota bacterium]MBI3658635.1 hypothetical protein [Acidobacteriota bacterium]
MFAASGEGRALLQDSPIEDWEQVRAMGFGHVNGLAYSPNGSRLAVSSSSMIQILNATSLAVEGAMIWHNSWVNSVAWSPDGRRVVSGSSDGTLMIWSAETYQLITTLRDHESAVLCVAWSPNGRFIASGSMDETVKIWNPDTYQVIGTYEGHNGRVLTLAIAPDNRRIASGSFDGDVHIWDVQSFERLHARPNPSSQVWAVAWSPNGRQLAVGMERTAEIWNTETYELTRSLTGYNWYVYSLVWSPNGDRLACGGYGEIKIWNTQTYAVLSTIRQLDRILAIEWSRDGQRIISGSSDTTILIWNARDYQLVGTVSGHVGSVDSVEWSPDGRRIATASMDGTIRMWNSQTYELIRVLRDHLYPVYAVAWSPDGQRFASASKDASVRVFDSTTYQATILIEHTDAMKALAWSPDRKWLAAGSSDGTLMIWDAETYELVRSLPGHVGGIMSMAWSPDSKQIACGSYQSIRVWDLDTFRILRTIEGHTSHVTSLAWSKDGRRLASASWDETLKIWDGATYQVISTLRHGSGVLSVSWSSDNKRILAGSYKEIKVWNGDNYRELAAISTPDAVLAAAWSPDGRQIVSGSTDGVVRIWGAMRTPRIQLDPASLRFSGMAPCQNPPSQTLAIRNSGGGTLSWTATSNQPWLSVTPGTGTAPSQVTVSVNSSNLAPGTYIGRVSISMAGSSNTPQFAAVTVVVGPLPTIRATPAVMEFVGVEGRANPPCQTLTIANSGPGTLNWSASSDMPWLTVTPRSGLAPSQLTVCINTTGMREGVYKGVITITSACAGNSPQRIPVSLIVEPRTRMEVEPRSFDFRFMAEECQIPGNQNLAITNIGGGSMRWNAISNSPWLSVNPNSGTAPSDVAVSVNIADLLPGTYNGVITMIAEGAADSPQVIPVRLFVEAAPRINLSPRSFTFRGRQGGPNPTCQTLVIDNGGPDLLTWSATSDRPWLTIAPTRGTAPSVVTVCINMVGLVAGEYTASIKISSPCAANTPQSIRVTLVVDPPPPVITLNPTTLRFRAGQNCPYPPNQILTITNSGGGTMNWSAESNRPWLSISPRSGQAPSQVDVSVNNEGLAVGTYSGTITVNAPGADNTPQTVSVTLVIEESPRIGLSPTSLTFQAIQGGPNPSCRTLSITYLGSGPLQWTAASDRSWLSLSPTSGTAPSQVTICVNVAGLREGEYTGTITVSSPCAANSPQPIRVTLLVEGRPEIGLSPTSFAFRFTGTDGCAHPTDQTLTIANRGGGSLNWTATTSQPWLSLSRSSGTAPSQVAVSVNIRDLLPGSHSGTIVITAPGAINTPQNVPVTLTVDPAPRIGAEPSRVNFQAVQGSPDPPCRPVNISNLGIGELVWAAAADRPWLSVTPSTGIAPSQISVCVALDGLSPGEFNGNLTLTSSCAINSPKTIPVNLTVMRGNIIDWEQLTVLGSLGANYDVTFEPNANRVAVGSSTGVVIWNVKSRTVESVLAGHVGGVQAVAWSPDGRWIASGAYREIIIWDAQKYQPVATLAGHADWVETVAWSTDSGWIASGSRDNSINIWNASEHKLAGTLTGHSSTVSAVAWSPDGSLLASGSFDQTIMLWDTTSLVQVGQMSGHSAKIWSLSWSPDSRSLVSGSEDRTLMVWDVKALRNVSTINGHTDWVYSVAWSPDGEHIASCSKDNTIKLWDSEKYQLETTLNGHTDSVYGVKWSSDGKWLVSTSDDKSIRIWDVDLSEPLTSLLGHTTEIYATAWSPDGESIAAGSYDKTVTIWNARSGEARRTLLGHEHYVKAVTWSPDGRRIVSGSDDETVQVWNVETGERLATLIGHSGAVSSVAWSSDGRRIASGSYDRTIRIWDATGFQPVSTLYGHTAEVLGVAWSPDGRWLASSSGDRTIRVWNAETGQLIIVLLGHTDAVNSVAWTIDGGRLATASRDNTVMIWDARDYQPITKMTSHTSPVWSVAWSPDGRWIASGGSKEAIIWNAVTYQLIDIIIEHVREVTSVSWSRTASNLLSSGSTDGTIRVFVNSVPAP